MPLGSAHRLAPEATFLDAAPEADRAELEAAFDRLGRFSPAVAGTSDPADVAFGLLEAQIDGLEGLWGPEPALVERVGGALEQPLAGRARAGIAGTRFAATVAALAAEPGTLVSVPPGAEAVFLAPLPASLLTPDANIRARLRRFGLRRIGQVAELAASALVARFGEEGARIGSRSRGLEVDPFRPRRAPERLALALPIEPAVAELEAIRFVLRRLAVALGGSLAARGLAAEQGRLRLELDLAFARAGTPPELTVETRFPEPTADAEAIERLLLAKLERTPPPAPVARLELELDGASPQAGQQLPLFVPQALHGARLAWQLARLALTYGEGRIRRVEVTDPEAPLPERRWAWRRRRGRRRPARVRPASPRGHRAIAVTRLLRAHPSITVEIDDGRVTAIAWADRREAVEVCNRWRVDESWWREPIARDYFKVVGEHWLALIYFDRISASWHLERLYD